MIDQRLLEDLVETRFATGERGRLVSHAPHLHVVRTPDNLIVRCRCDVADNVDKAVAQLAGRPRDRPSQWSREYADYARALSEVGPPKAIRAGMLFSFPERCSLGDDAIEIHDGNADLLLRSLDEWRPDVASGLPMVAMVVDGRAVSICASVAASKSAHCAGVETVRGHRGRGLAANAVAGWARIVSAREAEPFYGTTFDNLASQGVATRLDLIPIGSEFSIECNTG